MVFTVTLAKYLADDSKIVGYNERSPCYGYHPHKRRWPWSYAPNML